MHWSTHLEPTRPPAQLTEAARRLRDPVTAFTTWRRGDWLLFLLVHLCHRGDAVRLSALCAERAMQGMVMDPSPQQLLDRAQTWARAELAGDWRVAWDALEDVSHAVRSHRWEQRAQSTEQLSAIQAGLAVTSLVLDSRLSAGQVADRVVRARAGDDAAPEAIARELAEMAELLRDQRVAGRPLKDGELGRARPALQVCHDHVVTTLPDASLTPVSFLHAYVLRRALQAALVQPRSADHHEPWSGAPIDVDVHTLTAITQRIAASDDPVAHLPRVLQLLGLSLEAVGQWAGIRAIRPSP